MRRLAIGALIAILFLPLPARAWNAAGHRLSALIAWQRLDSGTRDRIAQLLSRHPDHERWISRAKNTLPELAAFLEASTWPDDIKRDKRFFDAGEEAPTAPLPGFPDMQRHRHWHYIDRALGHPPGATHSRGELDTRLALLAGTVGNRRADDRQRAYALSWLIHLVADAHQPLHVVSRYDAEGQGDEGGNLLTVAPPFHPRLSTMSLHAYWDDLPGPPWLRDERLERVARAVDAGHPTPPPAGGPDLWIEESWRLARDSAYPESTDPVPTLSAEFDEQARVIARRRIAEAGYRLAEWLERLLRK